MLNSRASVRPMEAPSLTPCWIQGRPCGLWTHPLGRHSGFKGLGAAYETTLWDAVLDSMASVRPLEAQSGTRRWIRRPPCGIWRQPLAGAPCWIREFPCSLWRQFVGHHNGFKSRHAMLDSRACGRPMGHLLRCHAGFKSLRATYGSSLFDTMLDPRASLQPMEAPSGTLFWIRRFAGGSWRHLLKRHAEFKGFRAAYGSTLFDTMLDSRAPLRPMGAPSGTPFWIQGLVCGP